MHFRALMGAGVLMTTALVLAVPQLTAKAALSCGEERWAVKTLSDRAAREVNFHARHRTVDYLRHLPRPDIGFDSPRQRPYEFRTYTVRAHLEAFVKEDDRDIHLIVSRPHHRHHVMITELPSVRCQGAASSIKKHAMRRARRHLVAACGKPSSSSFRTLHGLAKIKGVAFFDIAHGQSGAAPNYIELHPLLKFRMIRGDCQDSGGGGGGGNCDPSYPDFCIPPPPPDLDCPDVAPRVNFTVIGDDPHGFDVDGDGIGCEA
jgi:hypothetical protein